MASAQQATDGVMRIGKIIAFFAGIAFIGWIIYANVSGPAAMQQLEEIEEQAAVARAEGQARVEHEMRDAALAQDGWGSQVSASDAAAPPASASEHRQRLEDIRRAEEDDWGIAGQ